MGSALKNRVRRIEDELTPRRQMHIEDYLRLSQLQRKGKLSAMEQKQVDELRLLPLSAKLKAGLEEIRQKRQQRGVFTPILPPDPHGLRASGLVVDTDD